MQWYFFFFLVSGFCSVLYELVWLRLAMAQYGVTTPLISIVLSVFMLGLGFGSWAAGRLVKRWRGQLLFPAVLLYGFTELVIGCSALIVPAELFWGRQILERLETHGLSSSGYYLAAGAWIVLALVPWCAAMGATFPFALFAIEEERRQDSAHSFSFLYLANVLGAIAGTCLPLFLIELLGFHKTLRVSSVFNFSLAALAIALSFRSRARERVAAPAPSSSAPTLLPPAQSRSLLWLLFGTGLTSMAAEVVWVRMFTPFLDTAVYAFAAILACYLAATYLGSLIYRRRMLRLNSGGALIWAVLGFTVLLPVLAGDPRINLSKIVRLGLGLAPFSGLLGFVTPLIVDRISGGDGERAGRAYAVNVLGCILGPLLAGFFLLPAFGERASLCVLALPWFVIGIFSTRFSLSPSIARLSFARVGIGFGLSAVSLAMVFSTSAYEEQFANRWVRRDYTATVVAKGDSRLEKRLLINGIGMTGLRPITKMMAHLPLAMLDRKPADILIICFGMGTTHRSALSWGINSTVVELVPSVPQMYGFFHADGPRLLQSPRSHLVIDDGRLFLERTSDLYDVIIIDPPPPVEAAGTSLLYSKEFYALVKRHLRPGGILQQWLPEGGEPIVQSAIAKALSDSFPNVRVFTSVMDYGFHFLASMSPIPRLSAEEMASRMPSSAAADMIEWGPETTPERQFSAALQRELSLDRLIQKYPSAPVMVDDRPVNEYYYLRHRPALFQRFLAQFSVDR